MKQNVSGYRACWVLLLLILLGGCGVPEWKPPPIVTPIYVVSDISMGNSGDSCWVEFEQGGSRIVTGKMCEELKVGDEVYSGKKKLTFTRTS